jgi:hypothetical protein
MVNDQKLLSTYLVVAVVAVAEEGLRIPLNSHIS